MTLQNRSDFIVRVVDDDENLLNSLKFLLEVEGWQVRVFSSAEEFLEESDWTVPGCMILDIKMPGIDGLELQDQLVEQQKLIPIIFLTGHGDMNTAIHVFRQGAFDFLQKPVDPLVFADTVERAAIKSAEEFQRRRSLSPEHIFQELTDRQREVVLLMAEELDDCFICERLGISYRTLERHRQNSMHHLKLRTRQELKEFVANLKCPSK